MLSPHEFTVGTVASASPLALLIPLSKDEAPILVGWKKGKHVGIFLSGQFAFNWFDSSDNTSWSGLIVPNVRIEVDEDDIFDPSMCDPDLGCMERGGTTLTLRAKKERNSRVDSITLYAELPSTHDAIAGFAKWRIVIGTGTEERVLWERS